MSPPVEAVDKSVIHIKIIIQMLLLFKIITMIFHILYIIIAFGPNSLLHFCRIRFREVRQACWWLLSESTDIYSALTHPYWQRASWITRGVPYMQRVQNGDGMIG